MVGGALPPLLKSEVLTSGIIIYLGVGTRFTYVICTNSHVPREIKGRLVPSFRKRRQRMAYEECPALVLSSPMGSLSIGTLLGEIPRALTGESPIRKRKLTGAAAACSLAKTADMFGTIPIDHHSARA